MVSLLLALLLNQLDPLPTTPSAPAGCAVGVARAAGLGEEAQRALEAGVRAALEREGIPTTVLAPLALAPCGDDAACHARAGRAKGAGAVVAIDAEDLFGELTVALTLIDAAQGAVLADKAIAGSPDAPAAAAALADFSRTTRYALMTLPAFQVPRAREDAPVARTLTPSPAPLAALAPLESGSGRAPVLALTTTTAAVAAGATAALFGAFSYGTYQQATSGRVGDRVPVTREAADAMTRNSTVAGVAGAACVALTGLAITLWLQGL